MKRFLKSLILCSVITFQFLLSGCSFMKSKESDNFKSSIQVELTRYQQSAFKQVEASFLTSKSKELVFRVLSDIEQTPEWLGRVNSLEVLDIYNNQAYLLQTVIAMPWPFKDRELITCVDTRFKEMMTTIDIYSCSDRVPENEQYLRLPYIVSRWRIKEINDDTVEVKYKTWLDPKGIIPAFIFNKELIESTKVDFNKLQEIIKHASIERFIY